MCNNCASRRDKKRNGGTGPNIWRLTHHDEASYDITQNSRVTKRPTTSVTPIDRRRGTQKKAVVVNMLLATGHHRIMAAARGALVMMVFGKVLSLEFVSTVIIGFRQWRGTKKSN